MKVALLILAAALAPPTAHETRVIEGGTVHIDRRLLHGPDTAAGAKALD